MTPHENTPRSSRAYSERVLDHLREPVGGGALDRPDAVGEAGSRSCGDLVRVGLRIQDGIIADAGFLAFGCPATIATASESMSRLRGADIFAAASIGHASISEYLALPEHKRDCSIVAADALHDALEDWVRRDIPLVPAGLIRENAVLLAMSGGVDSSGAALFLKDAGLEPVGVTFRLWSDPACAVGSGCCSPETVMRARGIAHKLGMPHLTVDLTREFFEHVVEDFIEEYASARTPNPCVACNAAVRFSALAGLADRLGIERMATGHYARLGGDPARLSRAADPAKDQAYVLARVPPHLLERVTLPLGGLTKPQVRERAREADLEVHDAPESQEICFIPDDDYRRFLAERLGDRPGEIVDARGVVLGTHAGAYRYTIGQRKGLGLAAPEPLYVTDIRDDGHVVVGVRADLAVRVVELRDLVRHREVGAGPLSVQLRSSGLVAPVDLEDRGDSVLLRLQAPVIGVARGQTGVVFDGHRVVLAGVIALAEREH